MPLGPGAKGEAKPAPKPKKPKLDPVPVEEPVVNGDGDA